MSDRLGLDNLTDRLAKSTRTLITLAALAILVLFAVAWGWKHVTAPVPSLTSSDSATCTDRSVSAGDRLEPDTVTVSVLNAGDKEGLAAKTMKALAADGFAQGRQGNAPTDAHVDDVEIWTTDPTNPAVALVRSYLGGHSVQIERSDAGAPGIDVLVGDKFQGVTQGKQSVTAKTDASVCGP